MCASNEVQLGNAATLAYCYGSGVISRSDARDKTDVRNTRLGLDFIKALRPVDYRWDMREDYRPEPSPEDDATSTNGEEVPWSVSAYVHDGSKTRTRYHHGLIAQEVKMAVESVGETDFGGYQDHTVKGGDDVLSLGYTEFIAPLIKAVQQLSEMVQNLQERVQTLSERLPQPMQD